MSIKERRSLEIKKAEITAICASIIYSGIETSAIQAMKDARHFVKESFKGLESATEMQKKGYNEP